MKVFAIVASAGSGVRMDPAKDDKPFLTLEGKPLLYHTLSRIDASDAVDDITLIVKEKYITEAKGLVADNDIKKVRRIVPGGETRAQSVKNGLDAIKAQDSDIVLIHDGARPFLTDEMLRSVTRAAGERGAAVVGMPLTSTIKEVGGEDLVEDTVDRTKLWEAQTPQAFRYGLIKRAYEDAAYSNATDDASLVERTGHKVAMVEGSRRNIKVTVPEDIALAEALLKGKR